MLEVIGAFAGSCAFCAAYTYFFFKWFLKEDLLSRKGVSDVNADVG